jgi:hypothetical protein
MAVQKDITIISDSESLSNLLNSNFIINDHIINVINKEVVIASLQNQNIDYIQNVVICYIIKQFQIEQANTIGLPSHLEAIFRELIKVINSGIDKYFEFTGNYFKLFHFIYF